MAALGVLIGLAVGVVSGLAGLGGAIFIIPILVYVFGMTQHQAQGTSLAFLLLPIGFFAVLEYYRRGQVDIRLALLLGLGFAVGAYLGARWAGVIADLTLRRVFATILFLTAVRMWFR